ncbi:MAG: hypothetical protein IPM32_07255 [Ignavibacteriae bacterium]|nr:hypothetical protein [Ignavibacteriota bacterium]
MKKIVFLWILSFIITVSTAVYQRMTGPTYPISGKTNLNNSVVNFKFARSHGGLTDHEVKILVNNKNIYGNLFYKRYKTSDEWIEIPMKNINGELIGKLPHQPPAGKLQYFVELNSQNDFIKIPNDHPVIIRFKGDVPNYILIPHIIAMFMGMLFSTRTGLEYFNNGKNIRKLTIWTLTFLIIGGFILGPIMQKFAFGEYWTGFPFGIDLTDNKTLITILGWLFAFFMYKKSKNPKLWAAFASILLIIVYLIPHSVLGSELDYNKLDAQKKSLEKTID